MLLTAARARKICEKAVEKDKNKGRVRVCVHDILVGIQKDASCGYCRHTLDLTKYPEDIGIPIIHMLEDLGYKVVPSSSFFDIGSYMIFW